MELLNNMISLMLFGTFVTTFFRWFFNVKDSSSLYCGIFGGSFNRPLDESIIKNIKTLGLINQSRGEDSCGYFNGVDIHKGVDAKKKFMDLVIKDGIKLPDVSEVGNNIFIGHARKASVGSASEANAHPHLINNRLVLVHNGTIQNTWKLADNHKVDTKGIFSDSMTLGMIIEKDGYGVLDEYKGSAALAFHFLEEKGVVNLYHGKSKEYKNGIEVEERPLFLLTTEEGAYFSSIDYALDFIKREGEEVKVVPYNRIIKLKDGTPFNTKVEVNRGDCNVINYQYNNGYDESGEAERWGGMCNSVVKGVQQAEIKEFLNKNKDIKNIKTIFYTSGKNPHVTDVNGIDISNECKPEEVNCELPPSGKLGFWKGRYHIFTKDISIPATGIFLIDKKTNTIVSREEADNDKERRIIAMPLFKGVFLKTEENFKNIMEALSSKTLVLKETMNSLKRQMELKDICTNDHRLFSAGISEYSRYPVTCLDTESKGIKSASRTYWHRDSIFANDDNITPILSKRSYQFKEGKLIRINSKYEKDKILDNIEENIDKNIKSLPPPLPEKSSDRTANYYDGISEKDIDKYLPLFQKVFKNLKDAVTDLGDIGWFVLTYYAEDVFSTIFNVQVKGKEDAVRAYVKDMIKTCIEKRTTLEYGMDVTLQSNLKSYILDAIAEQKELLSESENDEDGIEDEGIGDGVLPIEESEIGKVIQMAMENGKAVPLINDSSFHKLNPEIEKEIEEDIIALSKKDEQDEEGEEVMEGVCELLTDLYKKANYLGELFFSDFAQDCASEVYRGIDNIVNGLRQHTAKRKKLDNTLKLINSN